MRFKIDWNLRFKMMEKKCIQKWHSKPIEIQSEMNTTGTESDPPPDPDIPYLYISSPECILLDLDKSRFLTPWLKYLFSGQKVDWIENTKTRPGEKTKVDLGVPQSLPCGLGNWQKQPLSGPLLWHIPGLPPHLLAGGDWIEIWCTFGPLFCSKKW